MEELENQLSESPAENNQVNEREQDETANDSVSRREEYAELVEDFSQVTRRGLDSFQEDQEGRNIEFTSCYLGGRYGVVIQTDERGLPQIRASRTDIDNRGTPRTQRFFMGLRAEASTKDSAIKTHDAMGRLDTIIQEFEVSSKSFDLVKEAIQASQKKGEERQKKLDEEEKKYYPPVTEEGDSASIFGDVEETLDLNIATDLVVLGRQTIKKKLGATLDKVDVLFFKASDTVEYADTQNYKIDSVMSRVGLSIDVKTKRGSRAFGTVRGASGGLEILKRFYDDKDVTYEQVVIDLAEEVAKEAVDLDKAQTSSFLGTSCPVILSSAAAGVLTHEAFGHIMESDIILANKEAKRADVNLKARIGGQVSENQKVNIVDTGKDKFEFGKHHIHNAYGAIARDDHGTPPKETQLVNNGVQVGALINRYDMTELTDGLKKETADQIKQVGLTGNVRSEDYSKPPIVRMTNTYMLPDEEGPKSLEEMAAKVPKNKKGIYIHTTMGGWVSPDSGEFQVIGNLAYLIENGQIVWTKPIKDVRITGNITKLQIKSLGASPTATKSFTGYCGKDGQSVPSEGRGPILYIEDANIGSGARSPFIEEYKDYISQLREVTEGSRAKESVYVPSVGEATEDKEISHSNVCMVTTHMDIEDEVQYLLAPRAANTTIEEG